MDRKFDGFLFMISAEGWIRDEYVVSRDLAYQSRESNEPHKEAAREKK